MPLIVNHDERRQQIAAAAAHLIAERGCENITLREVARIAGFSAAIIGHYFTDKLEMLVFTNRQSRLHALAKVEEYLTPEASPLSCLAEFLPLDEKRRKEWRMWFGFWGTSMAEPLIAAERLAAQRDARAFIARILERGQVRGDVPADTDIEEMAVAIQAMINGLASIVVHEPDAWPAERQRALLDRQVALLCAGGA